MVGEKVVVEENRTTGGAVRRYVRAVVPRLLADEALALPRSSNKHEVTSLRAIEVELRLTSTVPKQSEDLRRALRVTSTRL